MAYCQLPSVPMDVIWPREAKMERSGFGTYTKVLRFAFYLVTQSASARWPFLQLDSFSHRAQMTIMSNFGIRTRENYFTR